MPLIYACIFFCDMMGFHQKHDWHTADEVETVHCRLLYNRITCIWMTDLSSLLEVYIVKCFLLIDVSLMTLLKVHEISNIAHSYSKLHVHILCTYHNSWLLEKCTLLFLSFLTGVQVFSYAELNCGHILCAYHMKNLLYTSFCWMLDRVFHFKKKTVLVVAFLFIFSCCQALLCI